MGLLQTEQETEDDVVELMLAAFPCGLACVVDAAVLLRRRETGLWNLLASQLARSLASTRKFFKVGPPTAACFHHRPKSTDRCTK